MIMIIKELIVKDFMDWNGGVDFKRWAMVGNREEMVSIIFKYHDMCDMNQYCNMGF